MGRGQLVHEVFQQESSVVEKDAVQPEELSVRDITLEREHGGPLIIDSQLHLCVTQISLKLG